VLTDCIICVRYSFDDCVIMTQRLRNNDLLKRLLKTKCTILGRSQLLVVYVQNSLRNRFSRCGLSSLSLNVPSQDKQCGFRSRDTL